MYDVIIIGAGPSGGIASKVLAENGRKVLVIEKKREVGVPVHCGEGLSRYAVESNGLKVDWNWVRLRVKGSRIFVPNEKHLTVPGDGFAIDRHLFDKWLVDLAVERGAETMLSTNARGMLFKKDHWLVRTNKGEFKAKVVLAADGVSSAVPRWAGLQGVKEAIGGYQYKFKRDYVHKNMAYTFEGKNALSEEWFDFHYSTLYPQGYVWVFPRGDVYNIGICGLSGYKKRLEEFLKKRGLDPKMAVGRNVGRIPRSGVLPCYVKNQVLVVGDSGGLTNPITKGGVHAALFSGRTAAEVVNNAFEKEDLNLLQDYHKKIKDSMFASPTLMDYGKLIYQLTDEEANMIGEIMNGRPISECSYLKAFKAALKNPGIFTRIGKFLKIKKALDISQIYGW
ncbi:MAG TPA: NAD(P)/FAD-dependent oxidoreductase [Thermoplasmata archaeon]|nr:NAD(P)/FAD-dependent oxidoreductase [Thermoplasmata archaeon]